ncbi:MAG: helix-turn-helix domain-containing protein [Halalkalicoccus sp.]
MIDLAMDMEQYDCPFIDTTDDHEVSFSAIHWHFDTASERLETRMIAEADSRMDLERALAALREHDHLYECDTFMRHGGTGLVRTVIDQTNAMATIRENGGYITGPFHIEDGSECWEVGFDDEQVADDALCDLERENEFSVTEREVVSPEQLFDVLRNAGTAADLLGACRSLSTTERETLSVAVERGYFETPRAETLSSLGDRFGISDTAVSNNLRRAERKLLGRVVEAAAELDGEENDTLN